MADQYPQLYAEILDIVAEGIANREDSTAIAQAVWQLAKDAVAEAVKAYDRDRDDASRGLPLTGSSRKLGREWGRVTPGIEGRLISFGGVNDGAWAWIDVREERKPALEEAGQLTLAEPGSEP